MKNFRCCSLLLLALLVYLPLRARILRFPGSEYASVAVEIRDIASGRKIVAVNAEKMMTPASTVKLVTSAAALCRYGADYRYSTNAVFSGAVTGSDAVGNIVIKGAGDPTLYSSHFPENQHFIHDIVQSLQQLGVREIWGDIVLDDRSMPDSGPYTTWLIEDAFYGYGTGVYSFNFRDNTFRLRLDDLSTDPKFSEAEIEYDYVAGEELKPFHGAFSDRYILRGDSPMNASVTFPHSNPFASFAEELRYALAMGGIRFTNDYHELPAATEKFTLATYRSPEMVDILRSLMFRSDNMMAEATLRNFAPGAPLQDAIDVEKEVLKEHLGVENRYVRIIDGSGLTRKNFVSCSYLGNILCAMAKSGMASDYLSVFPKAGEQGTVRRLMAKTPLKGRLALKSGSMGGVRCLAGYFLDTKGRPVKTVVVMVNDFVVSSAEVNKAIEKYLMTELLK
ncbi:MAG: D-alanyl-D-alanine carboxypeptidase/D-alanyl-D-alanine-endopeptidase [Muribaculaceae bacterium]|nr:D-alanyl-D-alanine carboxypeptidase/D-alanyl-D-alanine-endopeptidase [Muribaculaceae bacterium]